ncbi:MAG: hypothetical protein M5U14_20145 [Acidimicrobiia bacterium]|nr:hypothetical protein [Acidimicrobiia bacterium]
MDLGQLVDQAAAGGGSTTSTVAAPTGSQAVKAGSLGYQDLVVAGPVGPITTATASPVPLDLDLGPGFDEGLGVELHVRVLPFSGDTYLGSVSNDVVLQTPDPESVAAAEALGEPEPPPGQKHYDLDVTLLSGPRPPDPRYMTCWQFVTWDWEKVDLSLFFQPDGPYKTWFWFTQAVGTNPICAGCYDFGSTKVALAGTSCDDGGFLDFLWESAKAFVDTLSSTFAFIKSALVDVVVTATGCKAAGGGSVCSTLAGVALDAALISLGIPPTLPDWDQLVASMKGDIVALGVSLAEQAGVPCDEASFATEIHGQDQFSCEAALSALVDEAVDQVDQAFADAANQMGFGFPPGMVVKPHPQGQVAPARVRIDVRQTDPKVTTLTGTTCDAGVFTTGWWAAKPSWLGTLFGKPASPSVVVEEVAPAWFAQYSQIPQAFWYGPPFELVNWRLPDLKKPAPFTPLVPASRTYSLYPPTTYELVPVAQFGPPSSFPGQSAPPTVTKLWYQWPRHVFLLNEGATFKLTVLSPCASGETHTYTLPGYAPGLAQEVGS